MKALSFTNPECQWQARIQRAVRAALLLAAKLRLSFLEMSAGSEGPENTGVERASWSLDAGALGRWGSHNQSLVPLGAFSSVLPRGSKLCLMSFAKGGALVLLVLTAMTAASFGGFCMELRPFRH